MLIITKHGKIFRFFCQTCILPLEMPHLLVILFAVIMHSEIFANAQLTQASEDWSFPQKIAYMKEFLTRDFTSFWTYKPNWSTPSQIGATPRLIQKSVANLGDESRLGRVLVSALMGRNIAMPIIGGSISRGAPFVEDGLGRHIYFNAIQNWWDILFMGIGGSKLEIENISLGGVGSDYFSYCLEVHLQDTFLPELIIWELSANDKGRYKDKPFPAGEPLEQLTRNMMQRYSKPALLFINFVRGSDVTPDGCPNYEDEGGLDVAKHYNITSLSWRSFICEYLQQKDPNFGAEKAMSRDHFHPSPLGHAQMAFIVINYLRNAFLRVLKGPAGQAENLQAFERIMKGELYTLPYTFYPSTSYEKPLCFSYLHYNEYEPNNTLAMVVTRQDDYKFNVFKQFKIRTDKLGGMQTLVSEQLIQLSLFLPRFFSRLVVTTHSNCGSGQVWLDQQTPVILDTDDYHMGTLVSVISTNLQPGKHTLNALSLKNGFAVCAVGVI